MAAVEPPVATVITSEPLKVIDVFVSPSPAIESNCNDPTFVKFESLRSSVPSTTRLPSMFTFSLMLIVLESVESNVVPFTLNALITTSPVPLGCMLTSALDPLEVITFVVISTID